MKHLIFLLLSLPLLSQPTTFPPVADTIPNVENLNGKWDKFTFLGTLAERDQQPRRRESDILLTHGYHSPEHLALLDTIRRNDSLHLVLIDRYLDLYGFPVRGEKPDEPMEYREMTPKEMRMNDSIHQVIFGKPIDSLRLRRMRIPTRREPSDWEKWGQMTRTIVHLLGNATDFDLRCGYLPLLEHEYREGTLTTLTYLTYLRHTYQIWRGEELPIATGSTEVERVEMYRRGLSGCL